MAIQVKEPRKVFRRAAVFPPFTWLETSQLTDCRQVRYLFDCKPRLIKFFFIIWCGL